jgi:large subunit ribosomal protein L7Ae
LPNSAISSTRTPPRPCSASYTNIVLRRSKTRLVKEAEIIAKDGKYKDKKIGEKPMSVKRGLNHCIGLIENKKAKLVVIAHDVDPIELVVYLPHLCQKNGVPYCIIKCIIS